MAAQQWVAAQRYIADGLQMPVSRADAEVKFGWAPADAAPFDALWAGFQTVHTNYAAFNNTLFPAVVALAGDISDYGHDQAPTYFGALKSVGAQLTAGTMTAADAQTEVQDILGALKTDAASRSQTAAAAQASLKAFVAHSASYQGALATQGGAMGVAFGVLNAQIDAFEAQIAADVQAVADAQAEMDHDAIILATTLTYAFVPIVGTIPAIVVTGVYMERLMQAAHDMQQALADKAQDQDKLDAALLTKRSFARTTTQGQQLASALTAALPVLAQAQGLWDQLATAFDALLGQISDASKVAGVIEALQIDQALATWKTLADDADRYRAKAFVTLVPAAQASAAATSSAATPAPHAAAVAARTSPHKGDRDMSHAPSKVAKPASAIKAAAAPASASPSLAPSITPDPNSPFFMSSTQWQTVQCYVQTALQLPTSATDAVTKLGISATDAGSFSDLWTAFTTVQGHCADFSNTTYPTVVALAGDISDFGHNEAPTYLPAITQVYVGMKNGTIAPADGVADIQAILGQLKSDTATYSANVDAATTKINAFITATTEDQGLITPIQTRYNTQYEGAQGKIASYESEISTDQSTIAALTEEYKHDCLVAETSPTYCWVFPAGTIAAAVVAGVYGAKATEALKNIRSTQADLASTSAELAAALLLKQDLKLAIASLSGIVTALNAALPVLQLVKGVWNALSTDLDKVLTRINNLPDPTKALPIIEELAVGAAATAWGNLANEADQFRVNAFVTVQTEAQIQANLAANPNAYNLPKAA